MHCGKCGAEISDTDRFCGKCGAVQERPRTVSVGSPRTKLLAAATITILVLAVLFGSGLIQQMRSGSPLSLPWQSTSTSAASSLTVTTSRTSAETSNIPSTMGTSSTTSTAETSSSTSSLPGEPPSAFSASLASAPTAVGCYRYGQAGWENIACLSLEAVQKWGGFPGPFLGIISTQGGKLIAGPQPGKTPLRFGIVMVGIRNFGSDSDSIYGEGAYSVQLNTNFFPGNNGHSDWVQFVYQDFCGNSAHCGDASRLCIWNIDVTTDQYAPTCVGPGAVRLSSAGFAPVGSQTWETVIAGWVASNGNLGMVAFLNGGVYSVVAPDQYSLASAWDEASGGMMGAGDGSAANFANIGLQTDISVASCLSVVGSSPLWKDCGGQPIAAVETPAPGAGVTAESNNLQQYDDSLTSYYSGSHWWLSSASTCNPASQGGVGYPGCSQFVDYGKAFGLESAMLYTVDVQPAPGIVNAGNDLSTTVDVVSVDGVQVGPITMSVDGMSFLGTEDLSGQTCTFSLPLQPGSSCSYTMTIHTSPTALPGSHGVTITGTPPPNAVPPPLSWGLPKLSDYIVYNLIINPPAPPSPIIVSPVDGASLNSGENTLIGYAHSTDTAEPSWVPCSRMQFKITFSDGSTLTPTPTQDSTFQQTGYCDTTVNLTVLGPATVTLYATSLAGVKGAISIAINIVSAQQPTPFTFAMSVTPSIYAIDRGGQGSFIVTVIATGGTPEPVQLSVSGLPQGATYTLSSNPVTPTTTLTLTINAATDTPLGSYTITITGTGGGNTASTTIQLAIASLG
jgi:hypothetical protein